MDDFDNRSRSRKLEKRRKNMKLLSMLIIIAGILLLILLVNWIFGGKDKGPSEELPESEHSEMNQNEHEGLEENSPEINDSDLLDEKENTDKEELDISGKEDESEEEDHQMIETTEVEPSDDNVIEAYTGNWPTIETVQEGPHTTSYSDGSEDRIEIKEATMLATGLNENLVEWRVENGGDQKVIATVSDHEETKIYRVYVSWIEDQGWQPTKVEVLKENDKK